MSYQVLARKWRPANFEQMVGQEHVLQALVNALDSGRLHHAYLFSGTRGVGKTTVARIFAKALNCEKGISARPCGECSSCAEIDQGRSVDLLEIDAASRTGVDNMRELLGNAQYAPTHSRFKIYLIDEVHMLSTPSFNAMLKTLEEPPPHVKFLLATTDPQKIPVTVLSRCLQFHLKRMSRAQILAHLQFLMGEEGINAEDAALARLAAAADGSLRDALSLTDQAIGYGDGAVAAVTVEAMLGAISRDYLLRLLDALRSKDAAALLREARAVIDNHPDYQRICAELIGLLQQVALFQVDPQLADEEPDSREAVEALAGAWMPDEVQLYYQILLQGRHDLAISPDEAAGFEMLMLRLLAFAPDTGQAAANPVQKKNPDVRLTPASEGQPKANSPPEPNTPGTRPPKEPKTSIASPPPEPKTSSASPPEADTRTVDEMPTPAEAAPAEPLADNINGLIPAAESAPMAALSNNVAPDDRPAMTTSLHDESADARPVETADKLDWSNTAYRLGLGGMAQEIVANCVVESTDNDTIRLALVPELAELLTERMIDEIRAALQQRLEVSLRLEFVAREQLTGESPLQAKTRRLEQERRDAIVAIRQDDAVLRLQRAFAVELDENSVVRQATSTVEEVFT